MILSRQMRRSRAHFFLTTATIVVALGLGAMTAAPSKPPNSTPQQVFDGMRDSFRAEKAKGLRVRYQFNLRGRTAATGLSMSTTASSE